MSNGDVVHPELGGQLRAQANFGLEIVHNLTDLPPEMESDESRVLRADLVQRLGSVAGQLIEASQIAERIGLPAFVPLPKGTEAVSPAMKEAAASAAEATPARARGARRTRTTRPRAAKPESADEPIVLTELDRTVFDYALTHPDFTFRQLKSSEELKQVLGKKNALRLNSADFRQARELLVAYAKQRRVEAHWFTTGETQAKTYFLQLSSELKVDTEVS